MKVRDKTRQLYALQIVHETVKNEFVEMDEAMTAEKLAE